MLKILNKSFGLPPGCRVLQFTRLCSVRSPLIIVPAPLHQPSSVPVGLPHYEKLWVVERQQNPSGLYYESPGGRCHHEYYLEQLRQMVRIKTEQGNNIITTLACPLQRAKNNGCVQEEDMEWKIMGDNLVKFGDFYSSTQLCAIFDLYSRVKRHDRQVFDQLAIRVSHQIKQFSFYHLVILFNSMVKLDFKRNEVLLFELNDVLHRCLLRLCKHQGEPDQYNENDNNKSTTVAPRTICILLSAVVKAVAKDFKGLDLGLTENNPIEHEAPSFSFSFSSSSSIRSLLVTLTIKHIPSFDGEAICVSLLAFSQLKWCTKNMVQAFCIRLQKLEIEPTKVSQSCLKSSRSVVDKMSFETLSLVTNSLLKLLRYLYTSESNASLNRIIWPRYVRNTWDLLETRAIELLIKWMNLRSLLVKGDCSYSSLEGSTVRKTTRNHYGGIDPPKAFQSTKTKRSISSDDDNPCINLGRLVNMLHSLATAQLFRNKRTSFLAPFDVQHLDTHLQQEILERNREGIYLFCSLASRAIRYIVSKTLDSTTVTETDTTTVDEKSGPVSVTQSTTLVLSHLPHSLSNIVNSFARLQFHNQALFLALAPTILDASEHFNIQAIAMTCSAYANLKMRHRLLMKTLLNQFYRRLQKATTQPTLEKFSYLNGWENNMPPNNTSNDSIITTLKYTNVDRVQSVATVLAAFAKLDIYDNCLTGLVVREMLDVPLDRITMQSKSNICFGLSYFAFWGYIPRQNCYGTLAISQPSTLSTVKQDLIFDLCKRVSMAVDPVKNHPKNPDKEKFYPLAGALRTQLLLTALMSMDFTNYERSSSAVLQLVSNLEGISPQPGIASSQFHREVTGILDCLKVDYVCEQIVGPYSIDIGLEL